MMRLVAGAAELTHQRALIEMGRRFSIYTKDELLRLNAPGGSRRHPAFGRRRPSACGRGVGQARREDGGGGA